MHRLASVLQTSSQRILAICLILATVVVFPTTLFGQAYFGTVSGVLTDASGAVVEGAKVVLTDQEKGYTFNTTSESSGRYLFRSIPPGLYSVWAEAKGFGKTVSARWIEWRFARAIPIT